MKQKGKKDTGPVREAISDSNSEADNVEIEKESKKSSKKVTAGYGYYDSGEEAIQNMSAIIMPRRGQTLPGEEMLDLPGTIVLMFVTLHKS